MKVLAINGSPNKNGNTAFALNTVLGVLSEQGIETDIIHLGKEAIHGCIGCGKCAQNLNRKCIFDDIVNQSIDKMAEADGLLLGSPVYYSAMSGSMKSFLDRAFFVASSNGGLFRHKAGAAVAAVRRAGSIVTIDQLHKYMSISEMVIATSNYWTEIHGLMPGEAEKDAEGIQCMQVLGENLAWLLKLMEHGKGSVPEPEKAVKVMTNFIR